MKFSEAVNVIRNAGIDPAIVTFFESQQDESVQKSDAFIEMEKMNLAVSKEYRRLLRSKSKLEEKLKDSKKELKVLKKQNKKQSVHIEQLLSEISSSSSRIKELEAANQEYQSLIADAAQKEKMHEIEVTDLKMQLETVSRELAETKEKLTKAIHMNFGASTETGKALKKDTSPKADPLDENAPEDKADAEDDPGKKLESAEKEEEKKNGTKKGRVKGSKNRMKASEKWDGLPWVPELEYSWAEIDAMFGEGNWTFLDFQYHYSLETLPVAFYRKCMLTQVLYVKGIGKVELTLKDSHNFQRGAMNSPSLLAYIITNRFQLGLPYYRQAAYLQSMNIPVSDKNMLMWIKGAVKDYYKPVYQALIDELNRYNYHHCDETTAPVLKNNKKSGTTCYMWVHTLSRLLNAPPIVIFSFEETRGTDHLRDFYNEFMGWIMCDAYISYEQLEKENPDTIKTSLCFTHLRRYFVYAARLLNGLKIPEERKQQSPEYKAIQMIAEIYQEEYLILRSDEHMDARTRVSKRKETVTPKVDAFFEYIHSLDIDAPENSASLKKAIGYARNHEKRFRRFLSDGNLEIDNSEAERALRGYCVGRRNWLFSDTVGGAENNAVLYSLVTTALQNKRNVFFYIRYVTEVMSQYVRNGKMPDMSTLMPWSEAYKTYEADALSDPFSAFGQNNGSAHAFAESNLELARFYPEKEKCSKAALEKLKPVDTTIIAVNKNNTPPQFSKIVEYVCSRSRKFLENGDTCRDQDLLLEMPTYVLEGTIRQESETVPDLVRVCISRIYVSVYRLFWQTAAKKNMIRGPPATKRRC